MAMVDMALVWLFDFYHLELRRAEKLENVFVHKNYAVSRFYIMSLGYRMRESSASL